MGLWFACKCETCVTRRDETSLKQALLEWRRILASRHGASITEEGYRASSD